MLAAVRSAVLRSGGLSARLAQPGCAAALARGLAGPAGQDDTHDDFKPQVRATGGAGVEDTIKQDISSHDAFVYMKGVPEAPQCGFSNAAVRILDAYGVKYGSRNVLTDADVREGIKRFTQWPTIPQVFIRGEFVGGSDTLMSMHQSGELTKILESQGEK